MANAAILVGNTDYRNLAKLECCRDDVVAFKELLVATEKYEEITVIENAEADELKSQLRAAIDKVRSPEELVFYFTGHGHQHGMEFFFCAINFDSNRPDGIVKLISDKLAETVLGQLESAEKRLSKEATAISK